MGALAKRRGQGQNKGGHRTPPAPLHPPPLPLSLSAPDCKLLSPPLCLGADKEDSGSTLSAGGTSMGLQMSGCWLGDLGPMQAELPLPAYTRQDRPGLHNLFLTPSSSLGRGDTVKSLRCWPAPHRRGAGGQAAWGAEEEHSRDGEPRAGRGHAQDPEAHVAQKQWAHWGGGGREPTVCGLGESVVVDWLSWETAAVFTGAAFGQAQRL